MTRLFVAEDFVHIGRGHKIHSVNRFTDDILVWCSHGHRWTFHKPVADFSVNNVWNGIYVCKRCGS